MNLPDRDRRLGGRWRHGAISHPLQTIKTRIPEPESTPRISPLITSYRKVHRHMMIEVHLIPLFYCVFYTIRTLKGLMTFQRIDRIRKIDWKNPYLNAET